MITIKGLCKSYGKNLALDNVSLTFTTGQSIALIGPNGSGKTTLFKSILGFVFPDEGNILFEDKSISSGPGYRKNIGYMPQMSKFPDQMRVKVLFELITSIRKDITPDQYDKTLYNQFKIESIKDKKLGDLSGGMRQQVSAALAFYLSPKIIILDEPTAGLDPLSNELLKNKIKNCLQSGEKLVLTASHILHDLEEICNHVVYLMEGKVIVNESIHQLRKGTSEQTLSKIIVSHLNQLNIVTN